MSLTPTFDTQLSRVRLAGTGLTGAATALFERSKNNILWTTVRGGSAVPVASNLANLDDYEFIPGVVNYYRVTAGANVFTANITPAQSGVWFKSITRPFLNRAVEVVEYSDITRPARNGIFEVIGRTYPIAVTDVRSSRRWTMQVKAATVSDADALDLVFASGDPLFIQTDGAHDIPAGYVVIGDTNRSKFGHVSGRREFDLPMVEVAPPGADIVGGTVSWASIVSEFATWADALAFFASWAEVTDYVASPDIVIVP